MSQQVQDGSQFFDQNYMTTEQNGGLTQQALPAGVQQPDTAPEDSKEGITMAALTLAPAGTPLTMDQNVHQQQVQQQQHYFSGAVTNKNWQQQQQQTMVNQEAAQPNFYAPQQPGLYWPTVDARMPPMNQDSIPPVSYPQAMPVTATSYGSSGNPVNSMTSSLGSNGSLHTMESAQIKREVSPPASSGDQYQQNSVQQLMGVPQQQAQFSPPQMQQQAPQQTQQPSQQQDFMHQQQAPYMHPQQYMVPMAQPFSISDQPEYQNFGQKVRQMYAREFPNRDFNSRDSRENFFTGAPWTPEARKRQEEWEQELKLREPHIPMFPATFWQQAHEADSYGFASPAQSTPKRRNRTKTPGFQLRPPYHKKKLSRKTSYNAKWGVKSLSAFLKRSKMEEDPTKLSKTQLTEVLPRYYQSVRKVDGNLYSYNSLVNIRAMLNSYLRATHPERIDIVVGKEFRRANEVFEGQLRKILHLNKPMTNGPISGKDMEEMIESGVFNTQQRNSLMMKVWFDMTRYLGNQTPLPQSQWTCDMLKVFFDKSRDSFYVTWFSPYADGQEHRMYETKTDGCPVGSLTYYMSKLNRTNSHVFQKTCPNEGHIWFGPETMGQEELDRMMISISEMAALSVKYTNQSVTVSAYSTLYRPRVSSQGSMETCEEFAFTDVYRCRAATSSHSHALNNFLGVPASRL